MYAQSPTVDRAVLPTVTIHYKVQTRVKTLYTGLPTKDETSDATVRNLYSQYS